MMFMHEQSKAKLAPSGNARCEFSVHHLLAGFVVVVELLVSSLAFAGL